VRAALSLLLAWLALAATPAYAAADLSIALVRSGVYKIGNTVSYTITVTNNGGASETGRITVGGTVPTGLTFTGASGSGWACAPGGALGNCYYDGDLASGASAPALTVTVVARTEGEKRVTASVSGSNDNVPANNTASDTAIAFGPADLSIAIARSGTFQVGQTITYAVTVTNKGTGTEFGRITVGGTVAPGLSFTGVAGTGWTCTAGGALGTCSYDTDLAANASTPALTITVMVNTEGEKKVTATVTGTNDPVSANNTTSDTGTALPKDPPAAPIAKFVITGTACPPGAGIGGANACQPYTAPTTAGRATDMYLTAIGADGKTMAPPTATLPMEFALRCLNPATPAGVKASIGGTALPACAPQSDSVPGSWSTTNVSFASGQASAKLSFQYADVGQVALHLRQGSTPGTTVVFVSRPSKLAFRSISRGGVQAPATVAPNGAAFAMAGEAVLVSIGALIESTGNPTLAPNFGKETARPAFALVRDPLYTNLADTSYLAAQPALAVDDATWTGASLGWSVNVSWPEVGATAFTADLQDYLGTGAVPGARQEVGRFYPAYFTTEITAPAPCGAGITCPVRPLDPIGVAFSGQPFKARVVARGVQGQELLNFTRAWFRTVRLSAVGPDNKAAPGVLAPAQLTASGETLLTHTLANAYASAQHRANNWSAPATMVLRAQAQDGLDPKGVSSDRSPAAASDEDGLVVVSGRLRVPNALGTDMLRTPLALRAEYWSGSAWTGYPTYTEPVTATPAQAQFSLCTRTLAGADGLCNLALVGASATPATVALAKGAAVLWLRAPGKQSGSAQVEGRRRDGALSVQFNGWSWLPSTVGRVHFGSHRSPLIYVREVY
jgi:MSHA biogenesis protein MshQ